MNIMYSFVDGLLFHGFAFREDWKPIAFISETFNSSGFHFPFKTDIMRPLFGQLLNSPIM